MPTLIVPIAPPASGKTFAISKLSVEHKLGPAPLWPVVISPDAFLMEGDLYVWNPERLGMAWRAAWTQLGKAFAAE